MSSELIFYSIISYLIGSIPFALIISKIFGLGDIRKIGSGNVGTTNVLRTGNKLAALLVLIFDSLKGFLPTLYLYFIFNNSNDLLFFFIGSLTIIGHIFPIWLKFKGGKGVATFIGFIFAINYILGLFFIFLWLFIAFFTKYASLASIISLFATPILILILTYKPSFSLFFLLLCFILILKHYSNILRLLNKSEQKIKL